MYVVKEKISGKVLAICSRLEDAMAFFSSVPDKKEVIIEEVVSNEPAKTKTLEGALDAGYPIFVTYREDTKEIVEWWPLAKVLQKEVQRL